jgi:hypothetical protein
VLQSIELCTHFINLPAWVTSDTATIIVDTFIKDCPSNVFVCLVPFMMKIEVTILRRDEGLVEKLKVGLMELISSF